MSSKIKLKLEGVDPYEIYDADTGELMAHIFCDPQDKEKDPKARLVARVFAVAFKMYDELETVILSKKKGLLEYWQGKEAKKIIDEIKGGGNEEECSED